MTITVLSKRIRDTLAQAPDGNLKDAIAAYRALNKGSNTLPVNN